MKTYSRKDYMDGKCTHSEYYGQWVNDYMRQMVERRIGRKAILTSKDPHFNDIPLREWDLLHIFIQRPSLAESVCVAKEAARQIQEAAQEKN